jgi:hypothetical protein
LGGRRRNAVHDVAAWRLQNVHRPGREVAPVNPDVEKLRRSRRPSWAESRGVNAQAVDARPRGRDAV